MNANKEDNNEEKEINEPKMKQKEIDIIKFYNKGIKTILDLINLNNNLKKNINESIKLNPDSNFPKGECYLIKENYFSNLLKFYSYEELYSKIEDFQKNKKEEISEIFLDLIKNYEKIYFDKIIDSENPFFL